MKNHCALAVALIGAILAPRALATVTVTSSNGSVVQNTFNAGKWTIVLQSTDSTSPTTFDILADFNDDIAYVGVLANNPGQVTILNLKGAGGLPRLNSVDVIERIPPSTRDVWVNELITTGDVGDIRVTTIVSTDIDGDVTGDVVLEFRQFGGESSIISMNVAGDMLGDILCDFGSIFDLQVEGAIGAPANHSNIRALNFVETLVAGDIYADISTVDSGNAGYSGHIEATTATGGTGVFEGSLKTRFFFNNDPLFVQGIFVDGFFDADVRMSHSFTAPAQMVLPLLGLSRTIVVNTENDPGGWWNAPIKCGADGDPNQVILAGPFYTDTPDEIGGGAVGLGPFRLHGAACEPEHGGTAMTPGNGLANPVVVRHYGPVQWDSAFNPLTIETRTAGSADPWIDLTFAFIIALDANQRDVIITPSGGIGFAAGFEYRIRPVRTGLGALRCQLITGDPLVGVDDPGNIGYDYTFTVLQGCATDLDGDGNVGSADLALILGSWGPCPAPPAICLTDVDGDGNVGSSDLAAILGSWGPNCGS